jgi:hypothetical protein
MSLAVIGCIENLIPSGIVKSDIIYKNQSYSPKKRRGAPASMHARRGNGTEGGVSRHPLAVLQSTRMCRT